MRTAEYLISFQSFSLLCHFRGEVFFIITFFNQPTKIKVQKITQSSNDQYEKDSDSFYTATV